MEIFGIGPLELLFIVLIALLVLGPREMKKSAQKAAGWIKKLRQSELWSTTKEVMDIPNQVMRETGLDEEIHELQNLSKTKVTNSLWKTPQVTPESGSKEPTTSQDENPTASEEAVEKTETNNPTPIDQTNKDAK
ncbi:MAG: hypothetical protein AB9897_04065 [Anaerolineaceae bacterium]